MKSMMRVGICAAAAALLALAAPAIRAEDAAKEGKGKGKGGDQIEAMLRNQKCPISGEDAKADKFIDYKDEAAKVYGRIHFCCGDCQGKADAMDAAGKKELYTKAYLAPKREGGKALEYGKTRIEAKNARCVVHSDHALDEKKVLLNYNALGIMLCCEGCIADVTADPDKHLAAAKDDLKAAMKARREERAKKKGDK